MAHPTAVLNVVGLSRSLIGAACPRIRDHGESIPLRPVLPAVTCSVQSAMLTGQPVSRTGVVGNGWFNREVQEIQFWKQANHLVRAEKVWETARRRDPSVTCANVCWWFNMYSSVDYSVTPRPQYKADGRKVPDCHTFPAELRDALQAPRPEGLGRFPLFHFWGPGADIRSSRWIAHAAQRIHTKHEPTLTLVYLPHLDYGLQKLGPDHPDIPDHVAAIDAVVGDLIDFYEARGVRVLLLSEYGIEATRSAKGGAAIPINRYLRQWGLLRVRDEDDGELLDPGASQAFAVADHQVAHVYLHQSPDLQRTSAPDRARPSGSDSASEAGPHPSLAHRRGSSAAATAALQARLAEVPGIAYVLDRSGQQQQHVDHPRGGDLTLVAAPGCWFSYDYWLDDARAPDFARTVEIHRKPGYDPRELCLGVSRATVAAKLLKRKVGFRQPLNVISLDTSRVRGTHGRADMPSELAPVLISPASSPPPPTHPTPLPCTAIRDVILRSLFDEV